MKKKPVDKQEPVKKVYIPITQTDIDATPDLERVWGTTRCLPEIKDIPDRFKEPLYSATVYNRIVDAWFTGAPTPDVEMSFNEGFRHDGKAMMKFIMAHLVSFQPPHEQKIAGCAYLLSQMITIKE